MNLKEHLLRQIAWSRETFGPGSRTEGVSDHIRKELDEIAKEDEYHGRAVEWVDVVILALDGIWRDLKAEYGTFSDQMLAATVCEMIQAKQEKNENRKWPDWRTAEPSKAIEHVRDEK